MLKKSILAAMFIAAASTFAYAEMAKKGAPAGPAPMSRADNLPPVASPTATKKSKKAKKAKKHKHKAKKGKRAKKKM